MVIPTAPSWRQQMNSWLRRAAGTAIALGFVALSTTTHAATVVKVELWDQGAGAQMRTDLAYPAGDAQHAAATMGVKLSTSRAPAGVVIFQVANTSKDTVHEMIVVKLADPGKPLSYDAKAQTLNEDKIGYVGEVEELDPGKSGTLTKPLKAGDYLLICNVAGHFAAGMWTEFTVTK